MDITKDIVKTVDHKTPLFKAGVLEYFMMLAPRSPSGVGRIRPYFRLDSNDIFAIILLSLEKVALRGLFLCLIFLYLLSQIIYI